MTKDRFKLDVSGEETPTAKLQLRAAVAEAEVARLLEVKEALFRMLRRRSTREAELRLREPVETKQLQDRWHGFIAAYEKAPHGSAMRAVIDAAQAYCSALETNLAALQQAVVDERAWKRELEEERNR